MKIEISRALVARKSAGSVALLTGAFLLLTAIQMPQAQAQKPAPAPNGATGGQWAIVDDQIVPVASVIPLGKTSVAVSNTFGAGLPKTGGALSFSPRARRWTGGFVPYVYDDSMSPAKRAIFEAACREWESFANLRFEPRATQANYIRVVGTANVSNSYLGMIGGEQVLNLADWANKYTAMHELAHALGVIHEQSRPDRDTYVTIHPENIADGMAFNFDKIAGALNQGDYDFDSFMHYPAKAFSKNGADTITTNAGYTQFQNKMGQRSHTSTLDAAGMAAIYGEPVGFGGAISPAMPTTNQTLTATPSKDLAASAYSYVWKKNGAVIPGETTNTLDLSKSGNGDKGDKISVEITGTSPGGQQSQETSQVTVVNSAPVTPDREFETLDTETLTGQLTATDDDGDPITFIRVANAEKGTLTLSPDGSFSYVPTRGFSGSDGFKVAANDGQTSGRTATIRITVTSPNQAPVLEDATFQGTKGFEFSQQLNGTDANGDTLTYVVTEGTLPDGITLTGGGLLQGRPTALGSTTFTVTVSDGRDGSDTAQITIQVKADSRPPAVSAVIAPSEPKTNDTITVTASIANPGGGEVSVLYNFLVNGQSVQSGSSKTLDLSQPGYGSRGDVITCEVTATNEGGASGKAMATTKVVNTAPFAVSGRGTAQAGVEKGFPVSSLGIDADQDALDIVITGGPANGKADVRQDANGVLTLFYTGRAGFRGTDVIRFAVTDGTRQSTNISTFAIGVEFTAPVVNRAPVAGNTFVDTFVGQSVVKPLLGSDRDGDALTFRIVNNARYGTSEIKADTDGVFKLFYTSLNRFYGNDRVTYIAIDSKGAQSNVATVGINFINRAPSASNGELKVAAGFESSQYLFGSDPDGDELSFRLVNNPRYGSGEIKRDAQGKWRFYYTALKGYVGPDRLTFVAVDPAGRESQVATINFDVTSVYVAPTSPSALKGGAPAPSSDNS